MSKGDWDYIIVGGGSAGCVLANRLSANPKKRVLLLDAGVRDFAPSLHIPAGMISAISNDKYNWKYPAAPDPSRGGQLDLWSAGKAIGGGSAINGMFYIRGHRSDFDGWAQAGCTGWDYDSVLPHFKSLESFEDGNNEYRGSSGPQSVTFQRHKLDIVETFINAAIDCGHELNSDYNGKSQTGVGYAQVSQKRGRRFSSASAFLHPVKSRKNLKVINGALVKRVLIRNSKASGVSFRQATQDLTANCKGEIILSAGALASPKILMHSGVGPGDLLSSLGIDTIKNLPQVGQNLMEHPAVYLTAKTKAKSLNAAAHPLRLPLVLANWLMRGRGPASAAAAAAQVLCHSRDGLIAPDIQLLFTPAIFSFDEVKKKATVLTQNGVSMAALLLHPTSRGRVTITSSDPLKPPLIEHKLLGTSEDIDRLVVASRKGSEILSSPTFSKTVRTLEPDLLPESPDENYEDYIRALSLIHI